MNNINNNTVSESKLLKYSKEITCPGCGSNKINIFYTLKSVPVHSVLLMYSRETALNYPKGDIRLGFCQSCGFISNIDFEPEVHEYSSRYEETQGFSPTFNTFSRNLANRLIDRYNLHNKDIIEIGCGKGEFLTLLCELGNNRGTGFDPAYIDERNQTKVKDQITFIQDFYSEKYSDYVADFICCKMTLEHIHDTNALINTIRRSINGKSNTVVFFQVPDATRIIRDCAFEDIYYEHCSYFSPGSLSRLFRECGFEILNLEVEYGDQYLMIEAKPSDENTKASLPQENDLDNMKHYVTNFQMKFREKLHSWHAKLHEIKNNGHRAVLWGSGSKAVAFLTTLNIDDEIEYAVDVNPFRQGSFIAGKGQKIVLPDFLTGYKPEVVIAMNPVYRKEIRNTLSHLGLNPELLTL